MHVRSTYFRFRLLLAGLFLLTHVGFSQTIRYVSESGTNANPTTATSWATSTSNLQGAINASVPGDRVWVSAGTYKPTGTGPASRTVSFALRDGVSIYGGFPATGTPTFGQRNVAGNPTILSGEIGDPNSTTDNSYHVVFNASGLTASALLDGFVLTGGYADGTYPDDAGAGMFNQETSPTINNCVIRQNMATRGGAGVYNAGIFGPSNPTFSNCSFLNNTSPNGEGGALVNAGSTGGNSSPTLLNCLFKGNRATNGGAILTNGSQGSSEPVITNCVFVSNTATAGGAIFTAGFMGRARPLLTNCTFLSNSAGPAGYFSGGAALYNDLGSAQITSMTAINCAFYANDGANTFSNNSATLVATYSLFEPSSATISGVILSGTGNVTTTTLPFLSLTDPQLPLSSSAIDRGDPATSAAVVGTTDLSGNARVVGGRVDIGAYEFQGGCQGASILSQLSGGTTVCLGNNVSVSVSTTGTVSSYEWLLNGQPVVGQTSATLSLTNVQLAGAGAYVVVLTGPCGSTTSTPFMLTVLGTDSFSVSSGVVCSGQPVSLTATNCPGTVSWPGGSTGPVFTTATAGLCTATCTVGTCSTTASGRVRAVGSVVYVSPTGAGSGDGSSWINALAGTALQQGIDGAAVCGGQIWVSAGTYKPTGTSDRAVSFAMRNGVAVYGGFVVGATSLTARNPQANPTILSGEIGNPNSTTDNSYNVIFNETSLDNTAILDGFVITAGYADSQFSNSGQMGGGVSNKADYFTASTPVFRNCTFRNNSALRGGGGMGNYANMSSVNPVLINCLFEGNRAPSGGAIFNYTDPGNASPILTNCGFLNNSATEGGALYNDGTDGVTAPVLTNCSFSGNTATQSGSVMVSQGSSSGFGSAPQPQFVNCVVFGNVGSPSFRGSTATAVASYSLFDPASATSASLDVSDPNNLTTSTSPFVSVGSLALNPCSSAVNTGLSSVTGLSGITTDLVGNPRFYANGFVDRGAVELQGLAGTPVGFLTQPPAGSAICAGGSVSVPLSISGVGTQFQLLRNGVVISTTTATGQTATILSFTGLTAINAGTYQVVAIGSCNSVTSTAFSLSINAPVGILTPIPASTVVCADGTFSAALSVSGTGPFSYELFQNGQSLGSQSSPLLAIPNLTLANSGLYQVVVTGACNSVTSTVLSLSVAPAAGITAQPAASSVVCAGTAVRVPVSVSGPTSGLQWYRGNALLSGQTSATLSLSAVTTADAGQYRLVVGACNPAATASLTSTVFSLTVNALPTNPSLTGGTLTCNQTALTLTASASSTGLLSYSFGPGTSPTANPNQVTVSTSGTYSVLIGANGCTTSATALVASSTNSPVVSLTSTSPVFCVGTSATLTASGGGTYTFGGPGLSQSGSGQTAIVTQSGIYSVVVTGTNGCTIGASLSVTAVPAVGITAQPATSSVVCVGTAVRVPVSVSGAVTGLQWYRGNALLSGQTSATLSLSAVTSADAGQYRLFITGGCNSLTTNAFSLTVNAIPVVSISATAGLLLTPGGSTTLVASEASTYQWQGGPSTASLTVNAAGTYSVTGSTAGCSATASVQVRAIACGGVIYVSQSGTGLQDGSSWGNALPGDALQTAINVAAACGGRPVWISRGIYYPGGMGNTARNASFSMRNNVAIFGGFQGTEATLNDRVLSYPPSTTLSGEIGDPGSTADNSYHVVSNPSSLSLTHSALLDGVVITGGNADGPGADPGVGGGMYNGGEQTGTGSVSAPTITNCFFVDNKSISFGGAMINVSYSGQPAVIVTNCTFLRNSADMGGAVVNVGANSTPRFINCAFLGNLSNAEGGAMANYDANPTLVNCSFQSNIALSQGGGAISVESIGGLFNPSPTRALLVNCVFWNNGGDKTLLPRGNGSITASDCLFEQAVTGYGSSPSNLTTTIPPFVSTSSVALNPCSEAIDSGDTDAYRVDANGPSQDVLGNARYFNSSAIDRGASEFAGTPIARVQILSGPQASLSVCSGATVTASVSAVGDGIAFQWYKGSAQLTGQRSATLSLPNAQPADAGSYQVVITGTCNALTSTAFSLSVGTTPTLVSLTGGTLTCAQRSVTIVATATNATQYVLTSSAVPNPGPSTTSDGRFVVSEAATYTLTATNSSGCQATAVTTVGSDTAISASLQPSSSGLCSGGSVTLRASGGAQYAFSGPGLNQNSTSPSATATQTGTYSVLVTGTNGCTATAGTSLTITIAPVVSLFNTGQTVLATGGISYQFVQPIDRINGYEIRRAEANTTGQYIATQPGAFWVIVTAQNGCSTRADGVIPRL